MAKTPQVGEQAPDFELPGTDGTFKLSEHRGERVVLLFYPGDNTMVCTKQFCSYRDRADDFAALDATVVGISSQDLDSHEGFIAKHGLNVPLLSDVDRQVARSYSAFSARLGIKRAVIAIDEQGVVRAPSRPSARARLSVGGRAQSDARRAARRRVTRSPPGVSTSVWASPGLAGDAQRAARRHVRLLLTFLGEACCAGTST